MPHYSWFVAHLWGTLEAGVRVPHFVVNVSSEFTFDIVTVHLNVFVMFLPVAFTGAPVDKFAEIIFPELIN